MHDVLALGQVGQLDDAGLEPLGIGLLGGERGLDLVVLDDPAGLGVDEEHPARLQAPAADHVLLVQGQDAGLGGQDDQTVVGDPVPARPQAVPVEHRSDQRAVGERHAGGPVPGLHEHRVELVEGLAGGVHLGVVLPRLGDHHQHGVRQGPATEVQQLEDLVEGRGVRPVRRADRVEALEVARDDVAAQHRLARAHPVAVALDGVDLAVVGDVSVGVRLGPGREGVGREPRVHQGQRRGEPLVRQVGVELLELRGGEHALVDEGARGQRRQVDVRLVLGALAQAERQPVELEALSATGDVGDEQLGEVGHAVAGDLADAAGLDRHLAPAEDLEVLLRGDVLDRADGLGPLGLVLGQEGRAHGIRAGGGEREVRDAAEELVGHLGEDAGAVAHERVGAGGAAVLQVGEGQQGLVDDVVTGGAAQGGHHGDPAGVVLVVRAVETLVRGLGAEARERRGDLGAWGVRGRRRRLGHQVITVLRAGPDGGCRRVMRHRCGDGGGHAETRVKECPPPGRDSLFIPKYEIPSGRSSRRFATVGEPGRTRPDRTRRRGGWSTR